MPTTDLHRGMDDDGAVDEQQRTPRAAARLERVRAGRLAEVERARLALEQKRRDAATALFGFEAKATRALHSSYAWTKPLRALKLTNLDRRLRDAIIRKEIRVLRSEWLLCQKPEVTQLHYVLPRRQSLERLERDGDAPFLSPREACIWLECGRRHIGVLSAGWLSPLHFDPTGERMHTLRLFLRAHCNDVVGVFVGYGCLYQTPRTRAEELTYGASLAVMTDLYASAVGTVVLQMRDTPPRPSHLDGCVLVTGLPEGRPEDPAAPLPLLQAALSKFGSVREVYPAAEGMYYARDGTSDGGEGGRDREDSGGGGGGRAMMAVVRFGKHADAVRAANEGSDALQAAATGWSAGWPSASIALHYNERAHDDQGSCVFETCASYEVLRQLDRLPRHITRLFSLDNQPRPKLLVVSIDGSAAPPPLSPLFPVSSQQAHAGAVDVAQGEQGSEDRIARAAFNSAAERESVLRRFREHRAAIELALRHAASDRTISETVQLYSGPRNLLGDAQGHGTLLDPEGGSYEGELVDGEKHGHGVQRAWDGSAYAGSWQHGKRHGAGTLTDGEGKTPRRRQVGEWVEDGMHGLFIEETLTLVDEPVLNMATGREEEMPHWRWRETWEGERVRGVKVRSPPLRVGVLERRMLPVPPSSVCEM